MKNSFGIPALFVFILLSCKKEVHVEKSIAKNILQRFVQYTIQQGNQFCDQNIFTHTRYSELKFVVKFDSSAIYTTTDPINQYDINKLYGFSDNNSEHQQFSARFGWRWSDNALRVFAYTYNNSIRESKEIGTVIIGDENNCSIKVTPAYYIFTLNNKSDSLSRKSATVDAIGYKLYPYFGGDETAPHKIIIRIKEL